LAIDDTREKQGCGKEQDDTNPGDARKPFDDAPAGHLFRPKTAIAFTAYRARLAFHCYLPASVSNDRIAGRFFGSESNAATSTISSSVIHSKPSSRTYLAVRQDNDILVTTSDQK
jgi:hypothetical protein